jgi:hypothetical protein
MGNRVFELGTATEGDTRVAADVRRALAVPVEPPATTPRNQNGSNMQPPYSAWANRSNMEPPTLDNTSNMQRGRAR